MSKINEIPITPPDFLCLSCTTPYPILQAQKYLICPQGHFFCSLGNCAQMFINLIFSEPHNYFPSKCPMCHLFFPQSQINPFLNTNEKTVFTELSAKFGPDAHKPEINHFETLIEELKGLTLLEDRLIELKAIIEGIIENESQVFCPNCGLGGRKDLECTHILCSKCDIRYCYVCGKGEDVVDKADELGDIYSHNENWGFNTERCPMNLSSIYEFDDRYPVEEEEESMNLFHELKIKKALKEAVKGLNKEDLEKMEEKFHVLARYNLEISYIIGEEVEEVIKRQIV